MDKITNKDTSMRCSGIFALFLAVQVLLLPAVLGGCNLRVDLTTTDAAQQAVSLITNAFAACTKCPCQIKVQAQARVVAEVRKNIFWNFPLFPLGGNINPKWHLKHLN